MDMHVSASAVIVPVLATGVVDPRILPLAGLRPIAFRLDRAWRGDPDERRTCPRRCAGYPGNKLIAGF